MSTASSSTHQSTPEIQFIAPTSLKLGVTEPCFRKDNFLGAISNIASDPYHKFDEILLSEDNGGMECNPTSEL